MSTSFRFPTSGSEKRSYPVPALPEHLPTTYGICLRQELRVGARTGCRGVFRSRPDEPLNNLVSTLTQFLSLTVCVPAEEEMASVLLTWSKHMSRTPISLLRLGPPPGTGKPLHASGTFCVQSGVRLGEVSLGPWRGRINRVFLGERHQLRGGAQNYERGWEVGEGERASERACIWLQSVHL